MIHQKHEDLDEAQSDSDYSYDPLPGPTHCIVCEGPIGDDEGYMNGSHFKCHPRISAHQQIYMELTRSIAPLVAERICDSLAAAEDESGNISTSLFNIIVDGYGELGRTVFLSELFPFLHELERRYLGRAVAN